MTKADANYGRYYLVFTGAALLYLTVFFALADVRKLILIMPDDAHYFFQTAKNIADGLGQTFDGINPTNGFQPLWLYTLVPVFKLLSGAPETLVRVCLIWQLPFVALALWLVYRVLAAATSPRMTLFGGVLLVPAVVITSTKGMESCLLVLTLITLMWYAWKAEVFTRHRIRPELVFGLLLGCLFLARLDMIFFALVLGVVSLGQAVRQKSLDPLVRIIVIGAASVAVVTPYLLYNQSHFGALMPISGQLKSSFPRISFSWENTVAHTGKKLLIVLAEVLYVAWYLLRGFRRTGNAPRVNGSAGNYLPAAVAVLAAGNILHFLYTAMYLEWAVGGGWHYISYNLFVALLAVLVGEGVWTRLTASPSWRARGGMLYNVGLGMLVLVSVVYVYKKTAAPLDDYLANMPSYDAAIWARGHTQPDDVFAFKDTGVFGYYSERRTINLDGLVNNLEFQESIHARKLNDYFARKHVDYLVYHAFDLYDSVKTGYTEFDIKFWSRKYKHESERLKFYAPDELYRSPTYQYPGDTLRLMAVVWRYRNGSDSAARPQ
jgi:hypothetical protein